MNRLVIIILNWNGAHDTIHCVESLLNNDHSAKILVVDNGSNKKDLRTLEAFLDKQKNTVFIKNKQNLGFAGGVNTGLRYAINNNYTYVALINNDAMVDTNWVNQLMKSAEQKKVAITTGLLLNTDGSRIDSTSEQYSLWGMPFARGRGKKAEKAPKSGYVFGATGGATLYKTSLFEEIGLFDESFFAYYEDVDISFRAQLAGHKVYYNNKAIAYHQQGASSKKIPGFTVYQTFKNVPLLYIKNVPMKLLFSVGIRLWLTYVMMFVNAVKKGSGWHALEGWFASIWYFWTSALWKRFTIQNNAVVSADYIRSIIYSDLPPDQTGMRKLRAFFSGSAK
jgi:GT2 family glycosyltransferase